MKVESKLKLIKILKESYSLKENIPNAFKDELSRTFYKKLTLDDVPAELHNFL